ncbi:DeoR family transcriptional regulator [Neorhizobium alkalisoli]|uniref:DeoR family transcriptional regulator n=1 Tax=Neorhizobium alkalisoli TaxID=528178 RepID=A0A561QWF3_9HYPH|nr:DeoR family transcriptional regulator [Neorhizobium alkalisoli]
MSATSLADEFDVSEDAIRRDLRALAAEGKCRRVYGGAVPLLASARPMALRVSEGSVRKSQLAQAAAKTIKPGELVFLDSGSTNLAMVDCLAPELGLTVATNSLDIAAALARREDIELILIGGAFNRHVGGSVDASAIAAVSLLNIDRCFIGACAVSGATGINVHDHADAIFKRAVLQNSATCSVLATSEKFQERAPYRIATPSQIETLFVESDLPANEAEKLTQAGFNLVRAAPASTTN